ncbi:hypothetical protein CALVIDRAFT_465531, partial [Calocera viscosa TUFC12733]
RLVASGYWPSTPVRPTFAFSLDLLDFYLQLFADCAAPSEAFCETLRQFHGAKEVYHCNDKGHPIEDPFRRPWTSAVQWYEIAKSSMQAAIEKTIYQERCRLLPALPDSTDPSGLEVLRQGRASMRLRQLCPACFASSEWGRDVRTFPDVIIQLDGNFHHRRNTSGGQSPVFYEPELFLDDAFVASIGKRMEDQRAAHRGGQPSPQFALPEEVVAACKESFKVAHEKDSHGMPGFHDEKGLVVGSCVHDIPLVVCNITTPGERQMYAIAIIQQIMAELPAPATLGLLYDVGCVLDHSCDLYGYLGALRPRVTMAVSILHSYGHQWACQLAYSPRRRAGFGLANGEGSERIWSRHRRYIPILRRSGKQKRVFILDRKFLHSAAVGRVSLGRWMRRRFKFLASKTQETKRILHASALSSPILEDQLAKQRLAAVSVRSLAPKQVHTKVQSFMKLQNDIEDLQVSIQHVRASLERDLGPSKARTLLSQMTESWDLLVARGDQLYAELGVEEVYPRLRGVPPGIVQNLILARNLKTRIRKRVAERMWERARLNRAAGGVHQPIGQKLFQQIKNGLTRRSGALNRAVKQFNTYVHSIRQLYDSSWGIALPQALVEQELECPAEDHDIWQDVFLSQESPAEPWMMDSTVREAITAHLISRRCEEEGRRLRLYATNMAQW